MDTNQLYKVLHSDPVMKEIFHGVYSIDKLPEVYRKPAALIVNLDISTQPGSHWISIYFDKQDTCEYFDSYGRPPEQYVLNYMLKYGSKVKHNKKCVQKLYTTTCGQLCVYFLVFRARGVPLKLIVQSLEKSYSDEFVTGFINSMFKINTVIIDKNYIIQELYKSI